MRAIIDSLLNNSPGEGTGPTCLDAGGIPVGAGHARGADQVFAQAARLFVIVLLFGVGLLARASTLSYTYDAAGRLVSINYGGNTNSVFTYDDNGNLLALATFVSGNPDVSITQKAAPSPAVAGGSLQYVVTVFNNTPVVATGVTVTNSLPSNAAFISAATSAGTVNQNGNVLSWNIGALTNGFSASLELALRPLEVGTVTNTATVSAAALAPNPADNTSTLVTIVLGPPALAASPNGPNLVLSWPISGSASFSVEYTTSLTPPPTWIPDSSTPSIVGNQFYLQEPLSGANRFYRLVSAP